jgi:hypothetical protein
MLTIGTPGMIKGRRYRHLNGMVEVFGIDSLSLMREFFEDGVRKWVVGQSKWFFFVVAILVAFT